MLTVGATTIQRGEDRAQTDQQTNNPRMTPPPRGILPLRILSMTATAGSNTVRSAPTLANASMADGHTKEVHK